MNSRKQGNGLIVVLIILTAIAFGVYSVSDLVTGELRLNKRAVAFHEAKQAAENLIQTNMAEMEIYLNSSPIITDTLFTPGINASPSVNNEFLNAYATDSNLVIPTVTSHASADDYNTQDTEVIATLVSDREVVEGWEGLPAFGSKVEILSKATVERPVLGRSTVRARQSLQIIDTPIFAYALFYNLPMEIAPGALMNVYGNVHVNGDAWFQSSNGLNFYDNVAVSGDLSHGRHPDSGQSASSGDVRIEDDSGELVNMKKDDSWPSDLTFSEDWFQSIYESAADVAESLWNGNLEISAKTKNLFGLTDYSEDADLETPGRQPFNSAYPIIQPTLNESDLELPQEGDFDYSPESYDQARANKAFEAQKYSYNAGLTVRVDQSGGISYLSYERDPTTNKLVYGSDGTPNVIELTPPDADIAVYKPYNESGTEGASQLYDKRQGKGLNVVELDLQRLTGLLHAEGAENEQWGTTEGTTPDDFWSGVVYVEFPQENGSARDDRVNPALSGDQTGWGLKLINGETIPNPDYKHGDGIIGTSIATNQMMYVEGHYNADGDSATGSPTEPDDPKTFAKEGAEAPAALIADSITFLSENWNDANSSKAMAERVAANTEVSAAIMTGNVPSHKGSDGKGYYSGGVENFPRFLEKWTGKEIRIRGSMVALFESEVGTERWGKGDVYSAPNRAWGFHEAFGRGLIPPGTPYLREYLATDFELLSEDDYNQRINEIQTAQSE